MDHSTAFITLAHSVRFNLFLLRKLPAAYFSGVRIKELTPAHCSTTVPYKWWSQNPFRSTYFACLAMAAELSTGALAMAQVYQRKPGVSMLVVQMEAEFFKKAVGRTIFICRDGRAFEQAVAAAIATGAPQTLTAYAEGRNEQGAVVAIFKIGWSFKAKRPYEDR